MPGRLPVPRSADLLALLFVNGSVLENTFARDGFCRKWSTNRISLLPSCGKTLPFLRPVCGCEMQHRVLSSSTHFRGITHLIAQFLGPSCLEYAVCTWSSGYTQNGNTSRYPQTLILPLRT